MRCHWGRFDLLVCIVFTLDLKDLKDLIIDFIYTRSYFERVL